MIGTISISGRVVKPFGPRSRCENKTEGGGGGAIMIYREQGWWILAADQENTETEFVSYEMDVHDEVSAKRSRLKRKRGANDGRAPI